MMMISSSINDILNSQLCSQSPYVLHSILVISSPEMHGTFILNVAHLICEPNFASTQSRPPSGWNLYQSYIWCKQVAKHQWWNNPSLKYFSADSRGFTSFRWHCNLPFQLNLKLTAQASLTPTPPFHALLWILPSWWSWWRCSFESTSWELTIIEQFISNIPFYYSHNNGDALSEGLLTTKYLPNCASTLEYFKQN